MAYLHRGGGLILVPAFIYILKIEDKLARGTATVCILPMVITSSIFYYKENFINWRIGILCAIWGIIGAIISQRISSNILRKIFAIFILIIAIHETYGIFKSIKQKQNTNNKNI